MSESRTDEQVTLVWHTDSIVETLAKIARTSTQSSATGEVADRRLLRYCLDNNHWSIFDLATICFKIITTRAISAQIRAHRSFYAIEKSQRYSKATRLVEMPEEARTQISDDLSEETLEKWERCANTAKENALNCYRLGINLGIPLERARDVLPMATETEIVVSATVRQWIHYCRLRTQKETQIDHRLIAQKIQTILIDLIGLF